MKRTLKIDRNLDKHLKALKSDEGELSSLEISTAGNGARVSGDLDVTGTINSPTVYAGQILGYTAIGIDATRDSVSVGGSFAYPMASFLGANPVAYAGEHWDGTALDSTNLHFENHDGTGSDILIRLLHTAGKYPEIVKTMEAIDNCGIYDRAVTFYDLDINGVETFIGGPTLSGQNDLGIVGGWRTV